MKFLSIKVARSLWLLHLSDLNPRGKSITRDALSEIAQRYRFATIPDVKDIIEARQKNQPFHLLGGVFQSKSGNRIDVAVTVYRDGIVADTTSSTSDGDDFLTDVFTWLHTDLGLLDHQTLPIRKLYVSEVYVTMEKSLNIINPKLEAFIKLLQSKLKGSSRKPIYEIGSLAFWIDPEQNPKHTHFRIERAEDIPFHENRYFSAAPLETDEHLKALELLEEILTK